MNQRTTGLVVGLVIFVILTVGLLASTIYFNVEAGNARAKMKDAEDVAFSANKSAKSAKDAFKGLAGFVMGDPDLSPNGEDSVTQVKKALNAEGVTLVTVTPDARVASSARRIVRLEDGRVVEDAVRRP